MADLQTLIEQHLSTLSDDEWTALTARVRAPKDPPPQPPLPGERRDEPPARKTKFNNPGMEEAYRRGFVDADGKQVQR